MGDCAPFIRFMLRTTGEALSSAGTPQVTPEVEKLLKAVKADMSRQALQQKMGLKDGKHFRTRFLKPALESGLIEYTVQDRPNSRLQEYRLTDAGMGFLAGR